MNGYHQCEFLHEKQSEDLGGVRASHSAAGGWPRD
jgi:hypothetical protein